MIDWGNLAANTLWVLGSALALATFSYASWQASLDRKGILYHLGQEITLKSFDLSGIMVCMGLAYLSGSPILVALWCALGATFLVHFFFLLRRPHQAR